jgi:hypothetical protein
MERGLLGILALESLEGCGADANFGEGDRTVPTLIRLEGAVHPTVATAARFLAPGELGQQDQRRRGEGGGRGGQTRKWRGTSDGRVTRRRRLRGPKRLIYRKRTEGS